VIVLGVILILVGYLLPVRVGRHPQRRSRVGRLTHPKARDQTSSSRG
jgi:hypothetical protein